MTTTYRRPIEDMQGLRLENLAKHSQNNSLDLDALLALRAASLSGCVDALKSRDEQQVADFGSYFTAFNERVQSMDANAPAMETRFAPDWTRLPEGSKRAACIGHIKDGAARVAIAEFMATNPEPLPGDPPIVRYGAECPGASRILGICRVQVVQRPVLEPSNE